MANIAKIFSRRTNENAFKMGFKKKIPIIQMADNNNLMVSQTFFLNIYYLKSYSYLNTKM